ncbi:MAG: hypothetical protein F4Y47_07825 [Acidobacteriia bacterium]|nr:hypothetical protein [Terriglobia bacterium]MYG02036.1 hypothetical protein [Terriglobia bacterium]MYK09330.1 hypothetical protein [Terriglobia bacterium]
MTGLAKRRTLLVACALALWVGLPCGAPAATHFLLVEGLGGERRYSESFREQISGMLAAVRRTAGEEALITVLAGTDATAGRIESAFGALAGRVSPGDALAVFLVGHGSHDGGGYKFNIPGPDVTGAQLKLWLDAVPAARQLVVSTTSSSGGALDTLKGARRVVITATKNGREKNATVFGEYFAEAFAATEADTNKNESISALEAFQYAESKVKAHYADHQRLATEHPQLQGERAESFMLARLGEAAALAEDPSTRELLDRRESLELKIADLTARKDELSQSEFLQELEALLLEMAEIQRQIAGEQAGSGGERQ